MSTRVFLVVVTLLAAALAGTLTAGYFIWQSRQDQGPDVVIGGWFELVDHTGEPVTYDDFKGKWPLIYFGYTYCPDFCPTSLTVMTQALERLGPLSDRVMPMMITIDPERDTVEALAAYHEHFDPRFVMMTGPPEQIDRAAKAWRVYYRKAESDSATDYLMDHSSITYLMGPDGGYVTHFGHDVTPEQMAETLREILQKAIDG
ncbi:MAG: SCO family protein [Alphaproteobacteria bacterium]|nr:SCO family protein [Alphaproteobacteria bacterium]